MKTITQELLFEMADVVMKRLAERVEFNDMQFGQFKILCMEIARDVAAAIPDPPAFPRIADPPAFPRIAEPEVYLVWDKSNKTAGGYSPGLVGYAFATENTAEKWRQQYRSYVPPVMPLFP